MFEILIALLIAFLAIFILIKNLKRTSKGDCLCNSKGSSCSNCPHKKSH
jgi:hypothetical protein